MSLQISVTAKNLLIASICGQFPASCWQMYPHNYILTKDYATGPCNITPAEIQTQQEQEQEKEPYLQTQTLRYQIWFCYTCGEECSKAVSSGSPQGRWIHCVIQLYCSLLHTGIENWIPSVNYNWQSVKHGLHHCMYPYYPMFSWALNKEFDDTDMLPWSIFARLWYHCLHVFVKSLYVEFFMSLFCYSCGEEDSKAVIQESLLLWWCHCQCHSVVLLFAALIQYHFPESFFFIIIAKIACG